MPLYHATLRTYRAGDVVTATERGTFYPQALQRLESAQPAGAPSRSVCVFAARTLEFCALYAVGQRWSLAATNFYEVEMATHWDAPMALVHAIQGKLERGEPAEAAVAEYWRPEKTWRFTEVFGPSMTIVGEVPAPEIFEFGLRERYRADFLQAAAL